MPIKVICSSEQRLNEQDLQKKEFLVILKEDLGLSQKIFPFQRKDIWVGISAGNERIECLGSEIFHIISFSGVNSDLELRLTNVDVIPGNSFWIKSGEKLFKVKNVEGNLKYGEIDSIGDYLGTPEEISFLQIEEDSSLIWSGNDKVEFDLFVQRTFKNIDSIHVNVQCNDGNCFNP